MFRRTTLLFTMMASFVSTLLLTEPASADPASHWNLVNMPQGVTAVSNQIYGLHMQILLICVVIGLLVFGVMFYSMLAHRKSRGAVAANFHESTKVELIWTVIPALILITMAVPATRALVSIYDTKPADIDIKITGYQWKWQYEYLGEGVDFISALATSESDIYGSEPRDDSYLRSVTEDLVLPVGKKIRFLITANDVIHSWWVPEFGVKKDAIPGFVNEAWAQIQKPGTYYGQCAELCGKGHAFMPIVIRAVPEDEYNEWLAEKKAAGAAVRELVAKQLTMDELMSSGKENYNRVCAACHMQNGEGVAGVFPALKGSSIATGTVENHLDIVLHGKPGTAMQAFAAQLSEVDLAAIITYERNAWGNDTGDAVQPIDIVNFKNSK